jgi:carbonic anhydrase
MSKFSHYEFRNQPWFKQGDPNFEGWNFAIPMKTLVIHCFDPRAAEIPQKVAEYFGDEVYPGENIIDQAGVRVGNTRTLFAESNGGGRAASALLSVAMMEYLFNVKKVVVVHHSLCGLTSFTPELLFEEYRDHYHVDISNIFDRESITIQDYEESLKYDVELLRASPAVPKHIQLYGFFYEISSGKLTEVVKDIPA